MTSRKKNQRNRDEAESERTYGVVKDLRKPLLYEVGDAGGVTPLRRNRNTKQNHRARKAKDDYKGRRWR